MYNPTTDCGNDYIEITNAGNNSVDLEGYYFQDGIDYTFPSGATIAPGASLVITDDQTAFYYHYGFFPLGEYQKTLNDSGERIALHGAYDVLIDEVTYNDSWGGGNSNDALQLIDIQLDNSNPSNWERIANTCGSPNNVSQNVIISVIDDQFDIDQNSSLSSNVLANDMYPPNATVQISTMPSNGTLIFNNDGSFDYTPNSGFVGDDSFTYEICIDAAPVRPVTYTGQVISSADDVEENDAGAIGTTSSDLEMMLEDVVQRAVGFRIQNIDIPQGQTLTRAYLEFTADENNSDFTNLTIKAEATGNALAIPATNYVLTNKNKTNATASWNNIPAWTEGVSYTSPDIKAVVQEIINRGDWASGNAMTFIVEGSGKRVARSFDGAAGFAPKLIVEYTPTNNAGQTCYQATVNVNVEATCVELNIQAYLEGNYEPTNNRMKTELNTDRGLLPGQTPTSNLVTPTPAGQPYHIAPWNYNGTEGEDWTDADYTADDVDWVLVSFRTGIAKNTEIAMTAGVLDKFGNINFPDRCVLSGDVVTQLYVVVEHRNHIGVMTPQPVNIVNGTLTYDFRAAESYRDPTSFGQKQLPTGEWVMFAGDADQSDFPSFDITGTDKTVWFDNNGVFDYYISPDFNLDGDINGEDKLLWFDNNGISSRVPK